jgi:type I restriction enzyme S subunit
MAPDVRATDFGSIPAEWRLEPVSSVGEVQIGRARSPATDTGPNMVPYLRVANVFDGWIDYSDVYSMHFAEAEQKRYMLRRGDILLNEGQSTELVGRSAIYDGPENRYCYQNSLVNFRCGPEVDSRFARAVFKRWLDIGHFKSIVKQTTSMAHLGGTRFANLLFPLPKLGEQKRIAEILGTLDEAIHRSEQIITKLKRVQQGLLHDLLTRGVDDNGELRDPLRHPEQFMGSDIGTIPQAWEAAPFRDYGASDRPYLKTGPFGSSLKQEHWVEHGIPVITIGALGEGDFIRSELLHVSEATAKQLAAYRVRQGDIVFSRVADVGRSVVVQDREEGWLMSSNLMWIALDQRRTSPAFVQANIAANPIVRSQIRRFVNAGGREVANARVLNSLVLPWPNVLEQERIVALLAASSDRITREETALAKLRLLKRGLADDLLTGRVRVTGERTTSRRSDPTSVQLGLEL